jgi:hypothetical protein
MKKFIGALAFVFSIAPCATPMYEAMQHCHNPVKVVLHDGFLLFCGYTKEEVQMTMLEYNDMDAQKIKLAWNEEHPEDPII